MNQIFFKSRYSWKKGNFMGAYDLVNEFLAKEISEEAFSLPDDFFDHPSSNFIMFFNKLLSNDCLRAAFCDVFPLLWENNPNNDLFTLLLIRDFSQPSMITSLGMEEYGFEDPEENFEKVISALRNTAKRGFLTSEAQKTALSGRVHIDFSYLKEILLESNWPRFKDELWAFEKELVSLSIPWSQMSKEDNNLLLSTSLYELFGRFDSREMMENENVVKGCLQTDKEWKLALVKSIEVALEESSRQELDELVKSSCQFVQIATPGKTWLKNFLDYTIHFDQKTFVDLYQNSRHNWR